MRNLSPFKQAHLNKTTDDKAESDRGTYDIVRLHSSHTLRFYDSGIKQKCQSRTCIAGAKECLTEQIDSAQREINEKNGHTEGTRKSAYMHKGATNMTNTN